METIGQKPIKLTNQGVIVYQSETANFDPKVFKKANMSDEYIHRRATKAAIKQYEKSNTPELGLAALGTIIVGESLKNGATAYPKPQDILLDGKKAQLILKPTVARKVKTALGTAKNWGIFLGAATLANKAANAVIDRVPPFKQFKKEHPNTTALGVIIGSVVAANNAVNPANDFFKAVAKDGIGKQIKEGAEKLVKESPLNRPEVTQFVDNKVFKPVGNFATNHRNAFGLGALGLIGAVFVKDMLDIADAKKTQKNVAQQLEKQRIENQLEIIKNTKSEKAEIHVFKAKA